MRADRLAIGAIGTLVIIGFVGLWRHHVTIGHLRHEIEGLQRALGPNDSKNASEGSVRGPSAVVSANERAELTRMRAEISVLKMRTQELAIAVKQGPGGGPPLKLVPASGWKNAGRDSPESAAESFMWASDSGDLEALSSAILLDSSAREKAAAILDRLPESARATYSTPEKLIALLLARDADARAMQVLGANTSGDDALVSLRLQKDDGKTKEEGYQFKRTTDGWRLVVPGKAVDKMGKKLTDPQKK